MDRVRFLSHGAKRILLLDFSNCTSQEILQTIETARAAIRKQPTHSVLTLTDVTNAQYDRTVTEALKQFAKHNTPYVKAGAVVGLDGLKKIIYKAVMTFSGRNLQIFDTRQQAERWLASQ